MAGKKRWENVTAYFKKSFPQFHPRPQTWRDAHSRRQRVSGGLNGAQHLKDLNFEMGWLLNCCNRGFSGFLVPQRREMKNNISQSLDLESFLLFPQEEKGKEKFQTFTLQRLFGLFFFPPFCGQWVTFLHFHSDTLLKRRSLSVLPRQVLVWKACLT